VRHRLAGSKQPRTINGSVEINRRPGTVRMTFLRPMTVLDRIAMRHLVREKYSPP
jgi:formamidase